MLETIITTAVTILGSAAFGGAAVEFLRRRKTSSETDQIKSQVKVNEWEALKEELRKQRDSAQSQINNLKNEVDDMRSRLIITLDYSSALRVQLREKGIEPLEWPEGLHPLKSKSFESSED